jgi:hypothetical protein
MLLLKLMLRHDMSGVERIDEIALQHLWIARESLYVQSFFGITMFRRVMTSSLVIRRLLIPLTQALVDLVANVFIELTPT